MVSSLFKAEFIDSAQPVVPRKNPKSLTVQKYQTGKDKRIDVSADKKRKALPPGKRISKSGKVYWETRANRSDIPGLGI